MKTVPGCSGAQAQPLGQQQRGPLLHPPSPLHLGRNPGATLAEGLRMSLPQGYAADAGGGGRARFQHTPVMVSEVVELFAPVPAGVLLDATVGAGGHATALLRAMPAMRLVGLDRDPEAVSAAREALLPFGDRATIVKERFDHLAEVLGRLGVSRVVGALFDLGVSSAQLDRPERGFSYRFAGPLDMRMGPDARMSASDLVNTEPPEQLAALFARHGEERFARRIAEAIAAQRPVSTTRELADVVASAVPAAVRRRGHPAKRVFQALRAAVNEELEVLPAALDAAIELLEPGGRIVVISYHSGEDRVAKARLLEAATGGCRCPAGLPCACGASSKLRLLARGARKPSPDEVAANHRAESARLRAAEKRPDGLGPERRPGGFV